MFQRIQSKIRGQAVVEFALVLPLLLLLVFSILQLLQIAVAQSILASAAAEAARSASVHNDVAYVNTILDGMDFGLRTREQAVETIVNVRARKVLPMLANTKATLSSDNHEDVVVLEADVLVLPLLPFTKITLRAEGRAFRADWVDATPLSWYPKQSCNLAAEVVPARPVIGTDTLSVNIHSNREDDNQNIVSVASSADVHWHMGSNTSDASCNGSDNYSCSGPVAASAGSEQAYAEVDITASDCNSGNAFRLMLPFYPHLSAFSRGKLWSSPNSRIYCSACCTAPRTSARANR